MLAHQVLTLVDGGVAGRERPPQSVHDDSELRAIWRFVMAGDGEAGGRSGKLKTDMSVVLRDLMSL